MNTYRVISVVLPIKTTGHPERADASASIGSHVVEQFIALEISQGQLGTGSKTSADVRRSFFPFAFNAVSENPSANGSNDLGFFQVTISSEVGEPKRTVVKAKDINVVQKKTSAVAWLCLLTEVVRNLVGLVTAACESEFD